MILKIVNDSIKIAAGEHIVGNILCVSYLLNSAPYYSCIEISGTVSREALTQVPHAYRCHLWRTTYEECGS